MKPILVLLALLVTPCLSAQELSFEEKIEKLIELSGAKQNFDVGVTNAIRLQRENNQGILNEEFFNTLEAEMLKRGEETLIPLLIPIYKKHLTEEEVDGLIKFFESDIGKSMVQKTPLIMADAMQVGAEWGRELGIEIVNKINNSDESKFAVILKQCCEDFKNGTFTSPISDEVAIKIERKDGYQTEIFNDKKIKYKIQWISDNRYTLTMLNEDGELIAGSEVTVNIYEVDEGSYKYIAKSKNGSRFSEGEISKVK